MCVLDIMSVDMLEKYFIEQKNLAEGKECCGFYICKKNLKWDK